MAMLPASLRSWRPSSRELQLLLACGGALLIYGLSTSHENLQAATASRKQARERLLKIQSESAALASSEQREMLANQTMRLSALSMVDATPAISQLRMREELVSLSNRAGLGNLSFVEENTFGEDDQIGGKNPAFSVIVTTLEADFDWPAIVALIGQIETYQTGYLIERLELRDDRKTRRLRASFRILHRNAGAFK